MKHLFIALVTTLGIIIVSCGGAKNAVAESNTAAVEVIEEKVTIVPKEEMAEPEVIETPEVPAIPETPETPEKPMIEKEVPATEPKTPEVIEVPEPEVAAIIEDEVNTLIYPNHSTFNQLLATHVSPQGNVNYNGFKSNWSTLRSYIKDLGEKMPADDWTREDKLSYWMNAYNAMTVDLILRNQPVASIKDIKDPWDQRLWKLGDTWYNLNQIEHQILRKMGDARIHFGINCASFSCPPLLNEAFTADKVESQLDALARGFVNDSKRNTITTNSIEISKIFTWFAKDFKTDGSLIDFLNKYSETPIASNAKKRYMDYDWTLNK